jgi:hypothetical protein
VEKIKRWRKTLISMSNYMVDLVNMICQQRLMTNPQILLYMVDGSAAMKRAHPSSSVFTVLAHLLLSIRLNNNKNNRAHEEELLYIYTIVIILCIDYRTEQTFTYIQTFHTNNSRTKNNML